MRPRKTDPGKEPQGPRMCSGCWGRKFQDLRSWSGDLGDGGKVVSVWVQPRTMWTPPGASEPSRCGAQGGAFLQGQRMSLTTVRIGFNRVYVKYCFILMKLN